MNVRKAKQEVAKINSQVRLAQFDLLGQRRSEHKIKSQVSKSNWHPAEEEKQKDDSNPR